MRPGLFGKLGGCRRAVLSPSLSQGPSPCSEWGLARLTGGLASCGVLKGFLPQSPVPSPVCQQLLRAQAAFARVWRSWQLDGKGAPRLTRAANPPSPVRLARSTWDTPVRLETKRTSRGASLRVAVFVLQALGSCFRRRPSRVSSQSQLGRLISGWVCRLSSKWPSTDRPPSGDAAAAFLLHRPPFAAPRAGNAALAPPGCWGASGARPPSGNVAARAAAEHR